VLDLSHKSKTWVAAAIYGLSVAPTIISCRPYVYNWDDAEYLQRSMLVSQGVWSGNAHTIGTGMISIRPPAMTLLGLPWGPLASWDAAGKCFVTLGWLTGFFAALCLYLLLRIGVKPVFLAIASLCVVASIGPYPATVVASSGPMSEFSTHIAATSFLVDGLLAWIILAAILLIPYEARTYTTSVKGAVAHGILWGLIFSSGTMAKVSFFYFIALVVPMLLAIRFRRSGLRGASAALFGLVVSSAPAIVYWLRWGRAAWENAKQSSFGAVAGFYYIPPWQFLRNTARESPGLAPTLLLAAAALVYLVIKTLHKRTLLRRWDFLALLVIIGFGIVVLASPNREIRFSLPMILATPFLIAILLSGTGNATVDRPAVFAAAVVFCGLAAAALPMRHRPDRRCLAKCDSVLDEAARCNAKRILLATASPTLNVVLMRLAVAVSPSQPSVEVDTLAFSALSGVPIAEDFRAILKSDEVVFQDQEALRPAYINQRASEYEQYTRQQGRFIPIRVGDDVDVYVSNRY
jgi:hypothetical protein